MKKSVAARAAKKETQHVKGDLVLERWRKLAGLLNS